MSSASPRLKRVKPERIGPIRNPAQRVGATRAWGPVEWGVKTAYTVIDEYMRRGRDAACGFGPHASGRRDMSDNRCGYGYSNPYAAWGQMWPFLAPWMQAMQAWSCAMAGFVPAASQCAPQPSWNDCATVPKVSVNVQGKRCPKITLCVDAGADTVHLDLDALKISNKPEERWLQGIKVQSECGQVSVVGTVPDDQPEGVYRGVIRDSSGRKRGELTVEISK